MRYRLTLDVEQTWHKPDARSDRPKFFTRRYWKNNITLQGDATTMIYLLRAKADEIERSEM